MERASIASSTRSVRLAPTSSVDRSTTFEVYPRTSSIQTYQALLDCSTLEVHAFLASVAVSARPRIGLRLMQKCDNVERPWKLADEACWDDDVYAWLTVGERPGGTDADFDEGADFVGDYLTSQVEVQQLRFRGWGARGRRGIEIGRRWFFRRSAGQPACVNLAYGLIAGSLAALTDGSIYSSDSAWHFERTPALPDEFLRFYFRPELALSESNRTWSATCIGYLAAKLGGA